jgi:hypothetical protein
VGAASDQRRNDNAFIKYMRQYMGVGNNNAQQEQEEYEDY